MSIVDKNEYYVHLRENKERTEALSFTSQFLTLSYYSIITYHISHIIYNNISKITRCYYKI